MTTAELGVATTSAATLSGSTTKKALVYYGPGKSPWEDEARPAIQYPGVQSCGSPLQRFEEQIFIF